MLNSCRHTASQTRKCSFHFCFGGHKSEKPKVVHQKRETHDGYIFHSSKVDLLAPEEKLYLHKTSVKMFKTQNKSLSQYDQVKENTTIMFLQDFRCISNIFQIVFNYSIYIHLCACLKTINFQRAELKKTTGQR